LAAALLAVCHTAIAGEAEDRLAILELMDPYGVVHDFGSPEEYADLFTEDGEIAIGNGPAIVKGRAALIEQGQRDHERFGANGPLSHTIETLNPLLWGINYFWLTDSRTVRDEFDG
jgi:hypothetical protein